MTIRTRLTLWYAAIIFVSLATMGILSYYELVKETPRPASDRRGAPAATQASDSPAEDAFEDVRDVLLWCGVPAGLLALGGGWWLMRKALAPVAALTQAAERLTEHHWGEKLRGTGNGDELDRLTEVFNAMTARLAGSFERIREFTLHASHELKTPLTVMHAELETALGEESLTARLRERLLSQLDEVQRLSKIVDALTFLTKADAGQIALARETVRLDELVRGAEEDAQTLGSPRGVTIRVGECEALRVTGDRHRLRQLLLNLVDNAVKYNHPHGTVTLGLRRHADTAEFTISNTGPGLPAEILPRVFERFFRGDASHSNEVEGCGLGLSIAQWIVTAHGGTIQMNSAANALTTVTVRLPHAQPV